MTTLTEDTTHDRRRSSTGGKHLGKPSAQRPQWTFRKPLQQTWATLMGGLSLHQPTQQYFSNAYSTPTSPLQERLRAYRVVPVRPAYTLAVISRTSAPVWQHMLIFAS